MAACDGAGASSPVSSVQCEGYGLQPCAGGNLNLAFCWYGESPSLCTSAYYEIGDAVFACASCLTSDLDACKAAAMQACAGSSRDL